jgi:hypothetical protein
MVLFSHCAPCRTPYTCLHLVIVELDFQSRHPALQRFNGGRVLIERRPQLLCFFLQEGNLHVAAPPVPAAVGHYIVPAIEGDELCKGKYCGYKAPA